MRRTLLAHYPTRKICQAAEIINARTYELATCESSTSRTIVLTANGLKGRRIHP